MGETSDYTEITAGSDFEIDVKDALTSSPLFSKTGVSLTGGAVYTMFMYNGATPSATLRAGSLKEEGTPVPRCWSSMMTKKFAGCSRAA